MVTPSEARPEIKYGQVHHATLPGFKPSCSHRLCWDEIILVQLILLFVRIHHKCTSCESYCSYLLLHVMLVHTLLVPIDSASSRCIFYWYPGHCVIRQVLHRCSCGFSALLLTFFDTWAKILPFIFVFFPTISSLTLLNPTQTENASLSVRFLYA